MQIKHTNAGTINKNIVIMTTEDKELSLYFSYETIIGFKFKKDNIIRGQYITAETFSKTTSKFQNELASKGFNKVNPKEFNNNMEYCFNLLTIK